MSPSSPASSRRTRLVVLAGPTCDETDVIYDRARYELPLDLAVGDRVRIIAAGAYTAVGLAIAAVALTPLVYFLPNATLAATIIVAVLSLVDLSILKKTFPLMIVRLFVARANTKRTL